jgi:hypothetical protein
MDMIKGTVHRRHWLYVFGSVVCHLVIFCLWASKTPPWLAGQPVQPRGVRLRQVGWDDPAARSQWPSGRHPCQVGGQNRSIMFLFTVNYNGLRGVGIPTYTESVAPRYCHSSSASRQLQNANICYEKLLELWKFCWTLFKLHFCGTKSWINVFKMFQDPNPNNLW